jgi:ankyrin repeat protein
LDGQPKSASLDAALIRACCTGDVKAAQVLLLQGANPNARDGLTRTPVLAMAATRKLVGILTLLMKHGARVDEVGAAGQTPLMAASAVGCSACCRALVAAGARVLHKDHAGKDAVGLATLNKHPAVAEQLEAGIADQWLEFAATHSPPARMLREFGKQQLREKEVR